MTGNRAAGGQASALDPAVLRGDGGEAVFSRQVLRSDGRGDTNQLVNAASDVGWEHFQTEILALLLWRFLSWLK